jgi:hypothetical protein
VVKKGKRNMIDETNVVKLDEYEDRRVKCKEPCPMCGDFYVFIRPGERHKLEARCVECDHTVFVLKPANVFHLVRYLRRRRVSCAHDCLRA